MLSIIATLEEFLGMLLGEDIHVLRIIHLTFNTLKMQRVLCWHTKIEELSPMLQYSSQQPFKAPLPGYTGSVCGGEETRRARKGFY